MKAKATVTNVGGLRGSHEFEFGRGKLNIVEASNSGGKSSVVRGIVAALSMPIDGDLKPFFANEAVRLGVKTDPQNTQEGFVHVLEDSAETELQFNGRSLCYKVGDDGIPKKLPQGDPRFMLTGVLSNQSKVLRQMRGQDERHEPDDFRWAVSELSLAARYDDVLSLLSDKRERIQAKLEQAKKCAKEHVELTEERKSLDDRIEKLDDEIGALKDKYKNARELLEEIETLRDSRLKKLKQLADRQGVLKSLEQKDTGDIAKMKKMKKAAKEKRKIAEAIDIKKLEKSLQDEQKEVETRVSDLIDRRNLLDGELNLLIVAQSAMSEDKAPCPLCGEGQLSRTKLTARLGELRKKKDELSGEISSLNMGIQRGRFRIEEKKREKKRLKEEALELEGVVRSLETGIHSRVARIDTERGKIESDEGEIQSLEGEIRRLSEKIGADDKEAKKVYQDKEKTYRKLTDRMAVVTQQLYETKVDFEGASLYPSIAIVVLERWLKLIDAATDYAKQKAEDQRKLASNESNSKIQDLLNRLGFEEFRTVMLNADYRLYVERFDEDKSDYVFQQVRTLSTSEQMSVALILQIALKETYLQETPFFILDDIIEDFDEGRRQEVLRYLDTKAKDKNWYIITTKLAKDAEQIRVR